MEDQAGIDAAIEKLHVTEIDVRLVMVEPARFREDRIYGTSAYPKNISPQEDTQSSMPTSHATMFVFGK